MLFNLIKSLTLMIFILVFIILIVQLIRIYIIHRNRNNSNSSNSNIEIVSKDFSAYLPHTVVSNLYNINNNNNNEDDMSDLIITTNSNRYHQLSNNTSPHSKSPWKFFKNEETKDDKDSHKRTISQAFLTEGF